MAIIFNREEWLHAAINELKYWFNENGHPIKKNVHASVGWPHDKDALGTTHTTESSSDKNNHVFISPTVRRKKVLVVLTHELCHVVDNCQSDHGAAYQKIAKAVGLVQPWPSSQASVRLRERLSAIEEKIGPYKSPVLSMVDTPPKQSTRMLKIMCPKCKWTARAARRWIDRGLPICFKCGVQFIEVKTDA